MLQQCIAVSAVPVVGFVLALLFMALAGITKSQLNGGLVLDALICGSGLGFGWFVPRWAKDGYKFAQLSWIAPTVITIILFASDAHRLGFSGTANEFSGGASEGLGLFLSMPMVSSITYSVGAVLASAWLKTTPSRKRE